MSSFSIPKAWRACPGGLMRLGFVVLCGIVIAAARVDAWSPSVDISGSLVSVESKAIRFEDLVPESRTTTVGSLGARIAPNRRLSLDIEWLRGGSLVNYAKNGGGSRIRANERGAQFWLNSSVMRFERSDVVAGLGWRYLDSRTTADVPAQPATRSIERNASLRVGIETVLPLKLRLAAWGSNGWTYGRGDNRVTGYCFEWQGLGWAAGIELYWRLFGNQ